MPEDSTRYEYANEAKTVVRQTSVVYHSLEKMEQQIEKIDEKLALLPPPKDPPDYETYLQKWAQTGLTQEEVADMIAAYNETFIDSGLKHQLEDRRAELTNYIKSLKSQIKGEATRG